MFDIAQKIRYLRREYPATTSILLAYAALSAFFWMGGPGMGGVFMMCGAGGLPGMLDALGDKRSKGNCAIVNGVKLVGDARDIASACQMQNLVTSYTKKLQHMSTLPWQTRDKIAAHLSDIEPSLRRLRMYDAQGRQVQSFTFTRQVYDPAGQPVEQTVASVVSDSFVEVPASAPASANLSGLRSALKNAMQNAAEAKAAASAQPAAAATPSPPAPAAFPQEFPKGPHL